MSLTLCYHKITSKLDFGICTRTPDDFRNDAAMISSLPVSERPVISFDDGYRNTFDTAYPILSDHGLTAQLFVITDMLGKMNSWDANFFGGFQHITLDEVKALSLAGWVIGSHTKTHRALTTLSANQLFEELHGSKIFLEDALGKPVETISFPFGKFNERVVEMCRKAGYKKAISISGNSPDGFVHRSLAVYRFDRERHLQAKLSKKNSELRRLRRINAFSSLTVM
ncbi:MAG: polysaccharide deacetylase family protein, partial [Chlorobiales bacterium]|nr:polysaccharide deacetylase family protein [Chlorobiales bacterium]